jgi:hypothetical protein
MEVSGQLHSSASLLPAPEINAATLTGLEAPSAGLDAAAMKKVSALTGNRIPVMELTI